MSRCEDMHLPSYGFDEYTCHTKKQKFVAVLIDIKCNPSFSRKYKVFAIFDQSESHRSETRNIDISLTEEIIVLLQRECLAI